ncbi:MAG: transcriptional repressor [Ilumatobacter sp.]|uniref:Fur family transcriptional regulator n=1 Tax=Ilumatobacter sp. TaxID=1967498 RepID=UPI002637CC61|nr:transcriptional repressor [Ilumatobacter sp.]MDJ0767870.1 transcriptional repressor [Ilumatobacter sp.]
MRAPAELVDVFRSQGLKVTPQRQLLFRLLHENDRHPTAESLHVQASSLMPGISLRTVYQTLTDLASMGELRQVSFGHGPSHFDPNVAEHHHAVCDGCGAITDVYVDGAQHLTVDGLDGFRPDSTSIVFHGTCTSCGAAATSPTEGTS